MYKEDHKLLQEIKNIRNLTPQTMTGYKSTIQEYTRYQQKSFTSLIREAEREEKQQIPWKNRQIRQRLINFRNHLIQKNLMIKTITAYLQRIKTIYYTYEIEIRPLPYISKNTIRKPKPLSYNDLPTKNELKQVILMSKPVFSAIVLFMTSTGCARKETLSLTINDFIQSTKKYHNKNDVYDVLEILRGKENIIGEWEIYRHKTSKYYTTFSSPESMTYLISYLYSRNDKLTLNSKLFKVNEHYLSEFFTSMNTRLKLGKTGTYNKLRSHALRKFHASNLYNDGMSLDYVNELQGKSKNKTDTAYFMINPLILRNEYVKHLNAINIMTQVDEGICNKLDLSDLEDFSGFY